MTSEERIKAAAEAMRRDGMRASYEDLARLVAPILNPEDFPPKPKWPTDESVIASHMALGSRPGEASFELHRERLREAFLADPIHKAAEAHRRAAEGVWSHRCDHCPVCEAVDEAGL